MAAGTVGPSYLSYRWGGRQWAFPIDAAAQVQAYRPGRLDAPLATWAEVTLAAARGLVLCPLRPPHSLMALFTLCGLEGRSPDACGRVLFDPEAAEAPYERLLELVGQVDPVCFELDPIGVLEQMSKGETDAVCAPLIYGYVSYALAGFRPERITFSDLPPLTRGRPTGSAIGGTGIAVSAMSADKAAATDFAYWIASGETQAGPYAAGGGQPAHSDAWTSPELNGETGGFYAATRTTLDASWLRPRHDGYMRFQAQAAVRLNEQLRTGLPAARAIPELNALFRESLSA
jgi:multiple sugar transport system substrate-binding protein